MAHVHHGRHGCVKLGATRAPTVGYIRSPNQKLGAIDPRAPVSDEPCYILNLFGQMYVLFW